jgi:hypothetical protein
MKTLEQYDQWCETVAQTYLKFIFEYLGKQGNARAFEIECITHNDTNKIHCNVGWGYIVDGKQPKKLYLTAHQTLFLEKHKATETHFADDMLCWLEYFAAHPSYDTQSASSLFQRYHYVPTAHSLILECDHTTPQTYKEIPFCDCLKSIKNILIKE